MTPSEIKAARTSFGLSQSAFADLIGVNPRTIRRWESGETVIPWRSELIVFIISNMDGAGRVEFIKSITKLA
jgi:DNA-binding transcriptional regulator YiaG